MGQDQRQDEIAKLEARLEALKRGEDAPATAPSKSATRSKSSAPLLVIGVSITLFLLFAAYMNRPGATAGGQPVQTPSVAEAAPELASAGEAQAVASPAWTYETVPYEMGGYGSTACVRAMNRVQLSWPYESQSAELCLRRHPRRGLDSYVRLPRGGQFMCHPFDGCVIRVRFDDGAVQSFSALSADDGSRDVIFVSNTSRLIAALERSDEIRIETEFYQAGSQVMIFPVAGYEPLRLVSKSAG